MDPCRCCFHNKDGQTVRVEMGDFTNDGDAISWARSRALQFPHFPVVKIWQNARLVECLIATISFAALYTL